MNTQTNNQTQPLKKLMLQKESICLLSSTVKPPVFGPTAIDCSVTC